MIINDQILHGLETIIKISIYAILPILLYTVTTSFERKLGFRSVGKMGRYKTGQRDYISFLQDLIKIYFKEPIAYTNTSFGRLTLSPAIAFGISTLPIAVIPICESFLLNNQKMNIEILTSKYSLLMFLGLNTLNIFAIVIIGWAINSNYSILSNLKKSMHFLASEVIIYLIVINMIITFGSADFHTIVIMQKKDLWGSVNQLGILIQPVLALIYIYYLMISGTFQNNKFAFEMQHSQHGISSSLNSVGLMLLRISDQIKFFIGGLIFSFLFLGGYGLLPGLSFLVEQYSDSLYFFQIISLLVKTIIVCIISIILRQSSFNMRADQVLKYTWKKIIPLLYMNTVGTIVFMLLSGKFRWI